MFKELGRPPNLLACGPQHCGSPSDKNVEAYFGVMVGFTQPFFITPCDGRKLR